MSSFADATRLLMDLQQVSAIVQSLTDQTRPEAIAKLTTDGLVNKFDLAFARIWLMETEGLSLRLVASSGMYTHTDGFFAKVQVGAFKVGKIAQNRIPFLSNRLADEPWVKDRDWAIAHHITGFAGYPLLLNDRVVGVLAVFSTQALSPEFLEVLQGLCTTLALIFDYSRRLQQAASGLSPLGLPVLSEQIAYLLPKTRLILVGTERSLPAPLSCLLLQMAEKLQEFVCNYCRLNYEDSDITLEAIVESDEAINSLLASDTLFSDIRVTTTLLGGIFDVQQSHSQKMMQIVVRLPYFLSSDSKIENLTQQSHQRLSKPPSSELSEREREIFALLAQGLRDRDIATQLIISESTVKFHINNALTKLKARTRYQALYKAIVQGEIA